MLLRITVGLVVGWSVWAIVAATTGWGKLSYLNVAFVSPFIGGLLALISLSELARSWQAGRPKRHAAAAFLLSVAFVIVPMIALLNVCDGCMD